MEGRLVRAVVAAGAEGLDAPVGAHRQDLRVSVDQPRRRGGSRRAEDHLQAVPAQDLDRLVEPAEVERRLRRLESSPGELRQTDDGESGVGHQRGVDLPPPLRPLLRVVSDAETRAGHQPFTPPAMIPETSRRWKTRNPITSGNVLTTEPAISTS